MSNNPKSIFEPKSSSEATKPFKVVDLFAGAGGMTLGFKQAGFKPVLAVEKEADFAKTYALNFGNHVLSQDVESIVDAGGITFPTDVVIGGPPCQGFSNLTGNRSEDPRRVLWKFFMDVVETTNAKVFVIENVPNLLTSDEGAAIVNYAHELGYMTVFGKLKASNFGVPQNRVRGFIIGSRIGFPSLPSSTGKKVSVKEAFVGIPEQASRTELPSDFASGEELHIARNPTELSLKRYALIPPGGNRFDLQKAAPELTPDCWIRKKTGGTDLFGRISWDEPARCTIRTEFYKPEKGRYLHPCANRPITHWEAARLQSFPDSFKWYGKKIRVAIQIGNAVPPHLAFHIGRHVMKHLLEYNQRPTKAPQKREWAHLLRSHPQD